ncbi:hypothetical protein ACTFBX_18275 [Aeromonas caviae]|jgi:hypothetical protein|uniref:Uncharacterized protein n=1 Tax=Aeromonas caviae TaxID=648 RepID=A0ABU5WBP2_AERCA|nr:MULTISPECIES: hypothetical protein [Aeromonas]MEA9438327.1 hypothetical protein [Aeromonas caviae]
MNTVFNIDHELADFDLDRMHAKARENLCKVANLVGPLGLAEWQNFIEDGSLNATAIIKEVGISRSSYYQNKYIVAYIQRKAQWLLEQNLLQGLPYQTRDDSKTPTKRYSPIEKSIQEKDKMIRQLQLRVAELESHLEGLKQEYKSLQSNSHQDQHRAELLELLRRVPR